MDPRHATPPEGLTPYRWQEEAAARVLERGHYVCAADPGAGKTIAALLTAAAVEARTVLIVSPAASVAQQWARAAAAWGMRATQTGQPGHGGKQFAAEVVAALQPADTGPAAAVIVPWSRLQRKADYPHLIAAFADGSVPPIDLLIVDESHYCQGAEATCRGKAALGKPGAGKRRARPGLRHYARHTIALTGTPSTSKPQLVRAQLLFAHVDRDFPQAQLQNRWSYERRWWGGRKEHSYAAGRDLWVTNDTPAEGHDRLVQRAIMRIDTASLRGQLPPHRRVLLEGFAARRTQQVPQELQEWSQAGGRGKIPALEDLADMRQEGTEARAFAVCEWANDWHMASPPGRLLMVWGVYQRSCQLIADALAGRVGSKAAPAPVAMLHGGLSPTARQQRLDAARRGELRVLVATHASTGTGVDGLQHVAAQALMVEAPWTPGEARQTEGRLFRAGQTNPVTSYWVNEGIEQAILAGIGIKAGALDAVLAGADAVDAIGTPAPAPAPTVFDVQWTWAQAPGQAPGRMHLVCWGAPGPLEWAGTAFNLVDPLQPARRVPVVLASRIRCSEPKETTQYGVWAWRLGPH